MRENIGLYRGKRIDNDEWLYGSLLKVTIDGETAWLIFGNAFEFANGGVRSLSHAQVDPKTVGEYTGLTDKNGKKIFEGDIVDLECDPGLNELWVFDYGNCGGVQNVSHDVGYMGFYLRPLLDNAIKARDYGQRDDPIYYLNAFRLRIVGNIHDNPELLEAADE